MALGIVVLDMFKLRGLSERGYRPIKMPQPPVQMWISAPDISNVAFKVLDVDGIEAHDCCVQSDVCFCEFVAEIVWSLGGGFGEILFGAIERFEELEDVPFVCFLRGCESTLVYSVIDIVIRPFIYLFDLVLQLVWVQH